MASAQQQKDERHSGHERQILLRSSSGSQACESTYHRTRELAMTTKRVFHVPNLVEETSLAELTLQGVTSGATV